MTAHPIAKYLTFEQCRAATAPSYLGHLDTNGQRTKLCARTALGRCPLAVALGINATVGATDVARVLGETDARYAETAGPIFHAAANFIDAWDKGQIDDLKGALGL